MMTDWELILEYIQLVIEASNLPKWGHYEIINNDFTNNNKGVVRMTEYFKFSIQDNCILLNNEIWATCEDKQDARKVVTALRDMIRGGMRLVKENEQLEKENKLLYEDIDFLKRFIEKQGFKVKLDNKLIE